MKTPATPLAAIVLAAGKGTRMKSDTAKVLHEVFYRPMLHYVLDAVTCLRPDVSLLIVGHQHHRVERAVQPYDVRCVMQEEQRGTGHAVLCAEAYLDSFRGDVMILCGDAPLLLPEHLEAMLREHRSGGGPLTIMTTSLENPANYGRIITDANRTVLEIVEEKDASEAQRQITLVNAGIYCVNAAFLFEALKQVTTDNRQREMYLTDIVGIAVRGGASVGTYEHPHPEHVLGVNSRVELARAHALIRTRRNEQLMAGGVTLHDPSTVSVALPARIGADTTLAGQVRILGNSVIGTACTIEPGVVVTDCSIGDNVRIGSNSVLRGISLPDGTNLPPLTHLDRYGER